MSRRRRLHPSTVRGMHSVAHHEVGHALADLFNFTPFTTVSLTVVKDGHVSGLTHRDERYPDPSPHGGLVSLFAGPHAQRLHGAEGHGYKTHHGSTRLVLPAVADIPEDYGRCSDLDKIAHARMLFGLTFGDLRRAEDDALTMLTDHWGELTTVAAALVERRSLTFLDVLDLLRTR